HNCELYVGFEEDLGNQVCQENCDSEECAYDGGDCVLTMQGFCNSGCFEEMLGNGVCEDKCLTPACEHDRGDCESEACSAGCYRYMVGDGLLSPVTGEFGV
ncbi:MAG: hypothetical protein J0651_05600, partial [Actinobacteria bacterium]|nr:hypothetical protein [Actinomycetota bacterium]